MPEVHPKISVPKNSKIFFDTQNNFKMGLKAFWTKKIFFFVRIFWNFLTKKSGSYRTRDFSWFFEIFRQKKSENFPSVRPKKSLPKKSKNFFDAQNHFKMSLKAFWTEKKNFFVRIFGIFLTKKLGSYRTLTRVLWDLSTAQMAIPFKKFQKNASNFFSPGSYGFILYQGFSYIKHAHLK